MRSHELNGKSLSVCSRYIITPSKMASIEKWMKRTNERTCHTSLTPNERTFEKRQRTRNFPLVLLIDSSSHRVFSPLPLVTEWVSDWVELSFRFLHTHSVGRTIAFTDFPFHPLCTNDWGANTPPSLNSAVIFGCHHHEAVFPLKANEGEIRDIQTRDGDSEDRYRAIFNRDCFVVNTYESMKDLGFFI